MIHLFFFDQGGAEGRPVVLDQTGQIQEIFFQWGPQFCSLKTG